jgi:Zn-dependent protease with chaperone function
VFGTDMHHWRVVLLTLTVVWITAGCAGQATSADGWVRRAGGLSGDAAAAGRVRTAAERLGLGDATGSVTVRLLDSRRVAAYAWPDGRVFVTTGLVARLDDDELAAAIAHEVGHLTGDGHLTGRAGLGGRPRNGSEADADARGVELLRDRALPTDAMERMLREVRDAHRRAPSIRRALDRRIAGLVTPDSGRTPSLKTASAPPGRPAARPAALP